MIRASKSSPNFESDYPNAYPADHSDDNSKNKQPKGTTPRLAAAAIANAIPKLPPIDDCNNDSEFIVYRIAAGCVASFTAFLFCAVALLSQEAELLHILKLGFMVGGSVPCLILLVAKVRLGSLAAFNIEVLLYLGSFLGTAIGMTVGYNTSITVGVLSSLSIAVAFTFSLTLNARDDRAEQAYSNAGSHSPPPNNSNNNDEDSVVVSASNFDTTAPRERMSTPRLGNMESPVFTTTEFDRQSA